MLDAFRRFYSAQYRVDLVQKGLRKQASLDNALERIDRGLPPRWSFESWMLQALRVSFLLDVCVFSLVVAALGAEDYYGSIAFALSITSLVVAAICAALIGTVLRMKEFAPPIMRVFGIGQTAAMTLSVAAFSSSVEDEEPKYWLLVIAGGLAIIAWLLSIFATVVFYYFDQDIPGFTSLPRRAVGQAEIDELANVDGVQKTDQEEGNLVLSLLRKSFKVGQGYSTKLDKSTGKIKEVTRSSFVLIARHGLLTALMATSPDGRLNQGLPHFCVALCICVHHP